MQKHIGRLFCLWQLIPKVNHFYWLILISILSCKSASDPTNPSPPLSAEEALKSFHVEDGFQIQLVASEPLIEDPVISLFDEYNRLWVVEMRGFMNDIERGGEDQKIGRISVLEDTTGDGKMDKKIIYLDSLIMPRALAVTSEGALVCENKALWITRDTNHDSRADTRELLDSLYAKNGMPEHSDNGLWRGLDNWYYNAKSTFRYKRANAFWIKDSTEFRGQWGINHDDKGRLIYNYNWSQLHGDLVPPNYFLRNKNYKPTTGIDHGLTIDRRVYPIRPTPAVNRGYVPGTLTKDSMIIEFTAACSPFIYREKLFPSDYYGNAFVCEPSGNLVKRNKIEENGILFSAYDPHPGKEFLASTDERFRPVHLHSGPDGALYITDMYRGLIQHGAYVTPYLRAKTIERNLVLPVHYGRIWKIVPKGSIIKRNPNQNNKLANAESIRLINSLSDSSGWKRDIAQRLLVEKNDPAAISPLKEYILSTKSVLGRLHAMWTLEGLNALDTALLVPLLNDENDIIFSNALRLLEKACENNDQTKIIVSKNILYKSKSLNSVRALQTALSLYALDENQKIPIAKNILEQYVQIPLIRDALISSLTDKEAELLIGLMNSVNGLTNDPNKDIFIESLAGVIFNRGNPKEIEKILNHQLIDSAEWFTTALISGFTVASNASGKTLMLRSKPDTKIREKLEKIMEWPGHKIVKSKSKNKNELTAAEKKSWATGRQYYLSYCAGCHGADGKGVQRMAPTLVNSEWVTGDKKRLSLIVLHGIEGEIEINNKKYNVPEILPVMPSHSTLGDDDITAILTYIRNEWGNDAGAMDRRTVGMTRILAQGRVKPWTVTEINDYIEATSDTTSKLK